MPKSLYVNLTDLPRDKRFTFLTEDVVSAATTIRVQSIVGFESLSTSSGQIVMIGKLGEERTDLVRTSNASATGYPSDSYKEITLRDAMRFDHPQDTKVTIVDWDRVEFQWAASVNGTKATVAAYPFNIRPDQLEMLYVDRSATAGYFFSRFNNTINSDNSDWSDATPYGGYDANSVYAIKRRAVEELGEEVDEKVITNEFLNECLWEARREYHQAPGKRPFRRKYNVDIGNVLTGSARIDLPTDVERPYSAENVYGVRIGAEANMAYYDKKEWDADYRNVPHSTLAHAYTRGTSTSIWVANGRDFSGSPTFSVEGMNIGASRITGETNSFKIITHGSYPSALIGSDVWENVSLGLPDHFTVFAEPEGSAHIYFNRPFSTTYVDQNIYADYYRTLVGRDSDADVLDEPAYDMFVHYLKAKIKHRRNKGTSDITQDADYKLWQLGLAQALAKEYAGVQIRISPSIDHLTIPD